MTMVNLRRVARAEPRAERTGTEVKSGAEVRPGGWPGLHGPHVPWSGEESQPDSGKITSKPQKPRDCPPFPCPDSPPPRPFPFPGRGTRAPLLSLRGAGNLRASRFARRGARPGTDDWMETSASSGGRRAEEEEVESALLLSRAGVSGGGKKLRLRLRARAARRFRGSFVLVEGGETEEGGDVANARLGLSAHGRDRKAEGNQKKRVGVPRIDAPTTSSPLPSPRPPPPRDDRVPLRSTRHDASLHEDGACQDHRRRIVHQILIPTIHRAQGGNNCGHGQVTHSPLHPRFPQATTPSERSEAISSSPMPNKSRKTSSVCCPRVGGGERILGSASENLTGGLTSFRGPQAGCSTSVTM